MIQKNTFFRSFFIAGFECASPRTSQTRLDLTSSTEHDKFISDDYKRLAQVGIKTVREGIRWHIIEKSPYKYDFSSAVKVIKAARLADIEVIWDLCHYGWPDDLDIMKPEFIDRFTHFTRAFLKILVQESNSVPYIIPINEISYMAWAGGEVGYFHPFNQKMGLDLKIQLVRATIESINNIWEIAPDSRVINIEPLIHVVSPDDSKAQAFNNWQFEARDMLVGKIYPEIGGSEKYLDILGLNYFPFNQWILGAATNHVDVFNSGKNFPIYKPFSQLILDVFLRYRRPMFVSETGTESNGRAAWLKYIMSEINEASKLNAQILGVCWYPILNYPGWDDNRHCACGLWDYANDLGERDIYKPLADEIQFQLNHN